MKDEQDEKPGLEPLDADTLAIILDSQHAAAETHDRHMGALALNNRTRKVEAALTGGRIALASLPASTGDIVEGLFPRGRVHIVAGPSGGGKTTLCFKLEGCLDSGEPFLGRAVAKGTRWAYVSGDRSAVSVYDTMRRCGRAFPVFSLVDRDLIGEDITTKVIPYLGAMIGGPPELIYFDGFTAACPGGKINDYAVVAKWLAQLQRYCAKMNITILGACHTTKVREGEKFLNPRQRIAGSVAWAGFTESVVLIEPMDSIGDDEDKRAFRTAALLPRNGEESFLTMKFNDEGKLEEVPDEKKLASADANAFIMGCVLSEKPIGEELYYLALWTAAERQGMARRTFDLYLAKNVDAGTLVKVKKGIYMRPIPDGSAPKEQEITQ